MANMPEESKEAGRVEAPSNNEMMMSAFDPMVEPQQNEDVDDPLNFPE